MGNLAAYSTTSLDDYVEYMNTIGLPPNVRIPNPPAARARAVGREVLRRDPPGPWSDNHLAQSEAYRGVAYLCIRAIAEGLSAATVRVSKKRKPRSTSYSLPGNKSFIRKAHPTAHAEDQDQEYTPAEDDHPIRELLEDPNPVDTFADFITKWVIQQELTGNAILWPIMDGLDNPVEMWVIPTGLTQQIPISQTWPCGGLYVQSFYPGVIATYGAFPGAMMLDNRDVVRCRNPGPIYQWDGYSPLTAGAVQIDVLNAIDQGRKNHMDNGWSPDVLLAGDGWSQETCDSVTREVGSRYAGAGGRKVFAFNSEGLEVKSLFTAAKDMDYPSGWDQMVKFACALWQTSSSIIGLTEADSYAAFYAKLKQRNVLCLQPRAKRMGDYLNKHLIWPRYGKGYRVEIDLPTIDDKDLLDKELGQDAGNGTILYNEYRGARNRPIVEGGDVPVSVYMAQLEAKVQQQNQPQQDPNAVAGAMGEEGDEGMEPPGGSDEGEQGEELDWSPDGSPDDEGGEDDEAGQEAIMAPILEAMGVTGGDEPGMVRKSLNAAQAHEAGKGPPPWKGAVYDEQIHRWVNPNKDQEKNKPRANSMSDVRQAFGNTGKDISDSYYDSLKESIQTTGDVPKPERQGNTIAAQALDKLKTFGLHKDPEFAEKFAAAHRDATANGGNSAAWGAALDNHFGGKKAESQPQEQPKPKQEMRPNDDLDAAFADESEPTPQKPTGPLRDNPDLDDAFGDLAPPREEKPAPDADKKVQAAEKEVAAVQETLKKVEEARPKSPDVKALKDKLARADAKVEDAKKKAATKSQAKPTATSTPKPLTQDDRDDYATLKHAVDSGKTLSPRMASRLQELHGRLKQSGGQQQAASGRTNPAIDNAFNPQPAASPQAQRPAASPVPGRAQQQGKKPLPTAKPLPNKPTARYLPNKPQTAQQAPQRAKPVDYSGNLSEQALDELSRDQQARATAGRKQAEKQAYQQERQARGLFGRAADDFESVVTAPFQPIARLIDWIDTWKDPNISGAVKSLAKQTLTAVKDRAIPAVQNVISGVPAAAQAAKSVDRWADSQAAKHAEVVAQRMGISPEQAEALLQRVIRTAVGHANKAPAGKSVRVNLPGKGGKDVGFTVRRNSGSAPPQPANASSRGSLPPQARAVKAFAASILKSLPR